MSMCLHTENKGLCVHIHINKWDVVKWHDTASSHDTIMPDINHSLLFLLSLIFLHSRNHTELQAMPILMYPLDTRYSDFEHVHATHEDCA